MLYLAEVQKKSGVFGGGKAELKLLAYQRGETWMAVSGEEIIPAEDVGNFNGGALVFAEVNANKQLQGVPKEAGRQLVSILQSYSRLQEKTKTQEEEIEQWKESLTYQSQELHRREMEMQAELEQLEQIQQESEQLESKRGEIEANEQEIQQLRQEIDRKQQELNTAWEQLHGQQAELEQSAGLDQEQANSLQEWLNYLAQVVVTPESVQEPLNSSWEQVSAQESLLDQHWQQLEQQRESAEQQQGEIDVRSEEIESQWQQWHQAGEALFKVRADLMVQQSAVDMKQAFAEVLRSQLQQLSQVSGSSSGGSEGETVDVGQLESISLHELQRLVRKSREKLSECFPFVSDQEEELSLQRQDMDELEAKMKASFGAEREGLETELADQQEGYKFLNETLVGQWRSLLERQRNLSQHQTVLWQRLGNPEIQGSGSSVDLQPMLENLSEELLKLEAEIETMGQTMEQLQAEIEQQAIEQEKQRNELKQQEQELLAQRSAVAELWGQVNLYQDLLQPTQDSLNALRQNLEAASGGMAQIQEMSQSQEQAIAQLQASISGLIDAAAVA